MLGYGLCREGCPLQDNLQWYGVFCVLQGGLTVRELLFAS